MFFSIEKLNKKEYDLMIIDIKKFNTIKSDLVYQFEGDWKDRMIFIADFTMSPNIQRLFEKKGVNYLTSPIIEEKLIEKVNHIICQVKALV